MNAHRKDWIVLRCRNADTLRLPQSLAWANIEAWSPALTVIFRQGETRARKRDRLAIMPSYVFARSEHYPELMAISEALVSPHPAFNIFRHHSGTPAEIEDRELDQLRVAEQKAAPRQLQREWLEGETVSYPEAGFDGLIGIVEGKQGKFTLVSFPGKLNPFKIKTCALLAKAA